MRLVQRVGGSQTLLTAETPRTPRKAKT